VDHTPFVGQVNVRFDYLNFEFILGERIDHFLYFDVLLHEASIVSQVFSFHVWDAILT
jgi:hypothetical protein